MEGIKSPTYSPFDTVDRLCGGSYIHGKLIRGYHGGSVQLQELQVNPYAKSVHRENGIAVWDNVLGIPTESSYFNDVMSPWETDNLTDHNTTWAEIEKEFNRAGKTPAGRVLRPTHKYVLDLMRHIYGWKILEGAHILAHRMSDTTLSQKEDDASAIGRSHSYMLKGVADIATSILLGTPLDVFPDLEEHDINHMGINISATTFLRSPVLRVPVNYGRAPIPDITVGYINAGVYVEPHPYGHMSGTNRWREGNRWSTQPTLVALYGWDLVDSVTHSRICAVGVPSRKSMCYCVHPYDMQPMDTFQDLIDVSPAKNFKTCRRYRDPVEWIHSKDFQEALEGTPPLPCHECIGLNRRARNTPVRPRNYLESRTSRDSLEWEKEVRSILTLTQEAVIFAERRMYGLKNADNLRRTRIRNHRAKRVAIRKISTLERRAKKLIGDGSPTEGRKLREQANEIKESLYSHKKE